jgi:hypothetical protein
VREIAAFVVVALILIGAGSIGKNISTVTQAAAATEAGLTFTEAPAVPIDTFGLMANATDLPASHYADYSLVFN